MTAPPHSLPAAATTALLLQQQQLAQQQLAQQQLAQQQLAQQQSGILWGLQQEWQQQQQQQQQLALLQQQYFSGWPAAGAAAGSQPPDAFLQQLEQQQLQAQQLLLLQQQQQQQQLQQQQQEEPQQQQQPQPQQQGRKHTAGRRSSQGTSSGAAAQPAATDHGGGAHSGGGGGGRRSEASSGGPASRLTAMQKYHQKRKQDMERMEQDVASKMEELLTLQRENRALRRRAEVLENMLVDIDKQLELMSSVEAPVSADWVTLVKLGNSQGRPMARWLHRVLERAASVDTSAWTASDVRARWREFVLRLEPLIAAAEAAQDAAARAALSARSGDNEGSSAGGPAHMTRRATRRGGGGGSSGGGGGGGNEAKGTPVDQLVAAAWDAQRRRRVEEAAAAAATSGSDMEGGDGRASGSNPRSAASGAPPASVPPSGAAEAAPAGPAAAAVARTASGMSVSSRSSVDNLSTADDLPPDAAGVPLDLFLQISQITEDNFVWLIAMMQTRYLLTLELVSVDLETGTRPLPHAKSPHWDAQLANLRMSEEQIEEAAASYELARRCQAAIMAERATLQPQLERTLAATIPQDGAEAYQTLFSDEALARTAEHTVALERMRSNMRKEGVVRNMVGFYNMNVISRFQLARLCVHCVPFFPMAWHVAAACVRARDRAAGLAPKGCKGAAQH